MEVILNNEKINVNIIRKNNKNIYFRFDDNLNLVITANRRVSERELLKLITKNAKSLERLYKKALNKQQSDTKFWYLGLNYEINYDENIKEIIFNNGVITCQNQDMLNKFLKNKTKEIFTYEVNNLKEIIKTPEFSLRIRKMKTRWGVCNYKSNTITLNSELIKYPKDLLRYVIIHEMCHFYHHDHSEHFWKMVSIYYPNYKEARKRLNNGNNVPN